MSIHRKITFLKTCKIAVILAGFRYNDPVSVVEGPDYPEGSDGIQETA